MFTQGRDEFYSFLGEEVEKHKAEFDPNAEPSDYTSAYLKEMHRRKEAGEELGSFSDWQLHVALLDMWIAGTVNNLVELCATNFVR